MGIGNNDLIEFFLPRVNKISPLNTIKEALFSTGSYDIVRNIFERIGICVISTLTEPKDFEKISQYRLVWYKCNSNNQSGYNIDGSLNFKFIEYINKFSNDPTKLPSNDKVCNYIQRLRNGWNYPIEIIVAYDTVKNIGIIVDGTGHALALYYLKQREQYTLEKLLNENGNVSLCQMNSSDCRNIFHYDFAKLTS